jgi:hypothetical protein
MHVSRQRLQLAGYLLVGVATGLVIGIAILRPTAGLMLMVLAAVLLAIAAVLIWLGLPPEERGR